MKKLNATTLRIILAASLFAVTALGVAGFGYARTYLQQVAVDTSHKVVDANASQDSLQTLQKIQKELEKDKDVIERTKNIVAESQSYQYQDQIISDLNNYAGQAGLAITNLSFSAAGTAGTAAPSTPTPAPSGGPASTTEPVTPTPSLKSTSVTVTLSNPVDYTKLLSFVQSVEQNLTKMQISRVSLSKGDSANTVTSDALTIEVYIK